jgi:hypothetical protein
MAQGQQQAQTLGSEGSGIVWVCPSRAGPGLSHNGNAAALGLAPLHQLLVGLTLPLLEEAFS